jgi:hypothetical protein
MLGPVFFPVFVLVRSVQEVAAGYIRPIRRARPCGRAFCALRG